MREKGIASPGDHAVPVHRIRLWGRSHSRAVSAHPGGMGRNGRGVFEIQRIACWYNAYVSSVPVHLLTMYGRG